MLRSYGIVLTLLLGRSAWPCDPSSWTDFTGWQSGCARILDPIPEQLAPGDRVTVRFQATIGGGCGTSTHLWVSHGIPDPATIGPGLAIDSDTPGSYDGRLYSFCAQHPNPPAPEAGRVVAIFDQEIHSVTFTIDPQFSDGVCISESSGTAPVQFSSCSTGTLVNGPAVVIDNDNGHGWSTVRMFQIEADDPFVVKRLVVSEADDQLVPGDGMLVTATLEKRSNISINGPLMVRIVSDDPVLLASEDTPTSIPSGLGEFPVRRIPASLAFPEMRIYDQLYQDDQAISLEQGIRVLLTWTQDGVAKSKEVELALERPDGSPWSVTYPDYSRLTGDPPAGSDEERIYHREGNGLTIENVGSDNYLRDRLVRRWALIGARGSGETPDYAGEAAENLAQFLADRMDLQWPGDHHPVRQVVEYFENGSTLVKEPCLGQAMNLNSLARTIGLRARELDLALAYIDDIIAPIALVPGADQAKLKYSQHAVSEIWFDGQWQWFDVAFDFLNGGRPNRDTPCFYFRWYVRAPEVGLFPYRSMYMFIAERALSAAADFMLEREGNDGSGAPQILVDHRPRNPWRRDRVVLRQDCDEGIRGELHLRTRSIDRDESGRREGALKVPPPITMLYEDGTGRRMGAAGPLTESDLWLPGRVAPLSGGGSVWEVPGGFYMAAGTPLPYDPTDPLGFVSAEEMILIPMEELQEVFSLTVNGIGTGAYGVTLFEATDEGDVIEVATLEDRIVEGETATREFAVDMTDPNKPGLRLVSDVAGKGCGCSLSDQSSVLPTVWMLMLGLVLARANRRRRDWS